MYKKGTQMKISTPLKRYMYEIRGTEVVPTSYRRKRNFLSERTTGPNGDGGLSVLKWKISRNSFGKSERVKSCRSVSRIITSRKKPF